MISKKDIKEAREKKEFGNEILYKMCKDSISHKNDNQISGKVWLIGRSYSVAIERVRDKKYLKGGNDNFYEKIVPKAFKKLDASLYLLIAKEISFDNLPQILVVHFELLQEIKKITGMSKRSLSSKYLHFHAPNAFFIYDSRAKSALNKEIRELDLTQEFKSEIKKLKNLECDTEYKDFCVKCLILRDWLNLNKDSGVNLSPRQIDNLLIGKALT